MRECLGHGTRGVRRCSRARPSPAGRSGVRKGTASTTWNTRSFRSRAWPEIRVVGGEERARLRLARRVLEHVAHGAAGGKDRVLGEVQEGGRARGSSRLRQPEGGVLDAGDRRPCRSSTPWSEASSGLPARMSWAATSVSAGRRAACAPDRVPRAARRPGCRAGPRPPRRSRPGSRRRARPGPAALRAFPRAAARRARPSARERRWRGAEARHRAADAVDRGRLERGAPAGAGGGRRGAAGGGSGGLAGRRGRRRSDRGWRNRGRRGRRWVRGSTMGGGTAMRGTGTTGGGAWRDGCWLWAPATCVPNIPSERLLRPLLGGRPLLDVEDRVAAREVDARCASGSPRRSRAPPRPAPPPRGSRRPFARSGRGP